MWYPRHISQMEMKIFKLLKMIRHVASGLDVRRWMPYWLSEEEQDGKKARVMPQDKTIQIPIAEDQVRSVMICFVLPKHTLLLFRVFVPTFCCRTLMCIHVLHHASTRCHQPVNQPPPAWGYMDHGYVLCSVVSLHTLLSVY